MKGKTLWRISVTTTPGAEEAVAELIGTLFGQPASTYYDMKSGVSTVMVYLPGKLHLPPEIRADMVAGLRRISRCGLKINPGKITTARVRQENWAESWKQHFKPIEIIRGGARRSVRAATKSLLIKPSWSRRKPRKGQAVVVLDPGLSFGTGHHPTTAYCLGEVVHCQKSQDSEPSSFLDLGTGSGILAIAAVKLGYSPVSAMDFDPDAVRIARANARINRVEQKLKIRRRDVAKLPGRPRRQYDLVCANLISNLLLAERRRIVAQLNRTGTLVLAGILKPEFEEVQKAYKTLGLRLISHREEKGWSSGSFRFGL